MEYPVASKRLEYCQNDDAKEEEHRDFVEKPVEHMIVLVAILIERTRIAAQARQPDCRVFGLRGEKDIQFSALKPDALITGPQRS